MTEMTNEELRYKSLAIIQAINEAHDKLYVVEHKRDGVWRLHLDMNISTIEAQSIMAMQELRRKWPAAEWRVSTYIPSIPASSGVPQPIPSVEEIIKMLGNGWKGFQLSDKEDLMFAIGQIRLAIMKCKPLVAPSASVEVATQANVEKEAR